MQNNQEDGPDAILNGHSTTEHPAPLLLGPLAPRGGHLTSPTFHRLQQQHAAPEDFAMSPTSATPSADDDAQHLLDNWCNTLSNGLPLDGVGASMGWSGWPGASEASGWVGMAPMLGANPKQQLPVISGDDSNLQHWEALSRAYVLARLYKWASIVYVWLFLAYYVLGPRQDLSSDALLLKITQPHAPKWQCVPQVRTFGDRIPTVRQIDWKELCTLRIPIQGPTNHFSSSHALPMRSMFCPTDSSSIQVHRRTPVTLHKIICITDPISGVADFEDTTFEIQGTIRETHFSSGAIKLAFDTPLSVYENESQIYLEAQRLTIGAHFLKHFIWILFAEAWLGQEVGQPSTASGTVTVDDNHKGITWLIEKKRATTVEHYTYTLNHQSRRQDLCAQPFRLFNKTKVMADIQGTPSHVSGKDVMILFDPMTHTKTGNSGIGDFGAEGIQTFLRDHKCRELCQS
ncbi:hypothetical protein C8J57DRAFT_1212274 [Mycena rebaudengoi]|nr:hypothetical protein C8J57DRAFT_1212274 [Mycena rebaudengoi]